jgi:hypothetical protein
MKRVQTLVLALALASACASLPLKQRGVTGLQVTHVALSNAQDFERQAYAAQTIPGLTAEKHQAIARIFSKAFDDETTAGAALRAWQAGQPVPTSLAALQADADQALAAVGQIVPQAGELTAKIQAFADAVFKAVQAIQGAK